MKTSIFSSVFSLILLLGPCFTTNSQNTFIANGNPVITHKNAADPAVIVYDKKLYLYVNEDGVGATWGNIVKENWLVFSSSDMKTWTEYPVPLSRSAFEWTSDKDEAWASHVVERNGKFYWYVTFGNISPRLKSIGVAVSDSPTGPFVDAIGKPLITNINNSPQNLGDVDPAVFIDDNGQAYIFWGGGQCFYAKLKKNMTELDGDALPIDLPMFWNGPWIHKYKKKYYLSFGQKSFPSMIGYAMSDNITGPWEYAGILSNDAKSGNPYQGAVAEFKGKWYYFYHRELPNNNGAVNRKICIDWLDYYNDGVIKKVQMTEKGIWGK